MLKIIPNFFAVLVFLVAFTQFILTYQGLSKWKGGGFGMYSDYHPYSYFLTSTSGYKVDTILALKSQVLLSDKQEIKFCARHPEVTEDTILVQSPYLNLDSLKYQSIIIDKVICPN